MNSEDDGQVILTFEGDETRGGPPGRLHRALVKFEKGGVSDSSSCFQFVQLTGIVRLWSK